MPSRQETDEYAATLVGYVEDDWRAFRAWLAAHGYMYAASDLDALHAELRKRAGQE